MRGALVLTLVVAAGCGGDEPAPSVAPADPVAVQGTLDLERAPAGPADAGTQAGHRGGAVAEVPGATFRFTGTVAPADAQVTVRPARRGTSAVVTRSGRALTVTLRGLRSGPNRFVVRASAPGRTAWVERVTIRRR